jgi:hypothetical protein
VYNSEDNQVFYAGPGENIKVKFNLIFKLKIKGIEEEDLMKGTMICN